jgi:TolB-like protein
MKLSLSTAFAALLVLGGCAAEVAPPKIGSGADPIIFSSHAAADQLVQTMNARLDPAAPVLVATVSDISQLEEASPLGRLIAEQLASRLANAGYTVMEIKLRQGLLVREREGQFVLSRDARQLSQTAGAQAVVAGTYTQAKDAVYVNLKILRAADGRILGGHDYKLPVDDNVRRLTSLAGTRY